jgi:Putative transposase/Transposase zinc-binding domain
MTQSNSEIRQLLQKKIFNHPSICKYNPYSQSVFSRLSKCHTKDIGVHLYKCNNGKCNHIHQQYHSCGNRHCPNCGGAKRDQWIDDRMSELLPTKYYHIVFTVPHELHGLFLINRKKMFDLIFEAGHYTLTKLGRDPQWLGATPGIVSILHTNGQDLSFHPHIHCIVSGGGVDKEGKWIHGKRSNGKFLFPRRVMEVMYKAYFVKKVKQMLGDGQIVIPQFFNAKTIEDVGFKKWNIYAKSPFGGPAQIIEYLGKYTHKVAITSYRITEITNTSITFNYKDYKDESKVKSMTLTLEEFVRRFELHILPYKYVKIRHAGYMCHRGKINRIADLYMQLKLPKPIPKISISTGLRILIKTGVDITVCKKCSVGKMVLIDSLIMWNEVLRSVHIIRNRGKPC